MTLYKEAARGKNYPLSVVRYRAFEYSHYPCSVSFITDKREEYDGVLTPLTTMSESLRKALYSGIERSETYDFPVPFQAILGETYKIPDYRNALLDQGNFSVDPFDNFLSDYIDASNGEYRRKLETLSPFRFTSNSSHVFRNLGEELEFPEMNELFPYGAILKDIFDESYSGVEWRRRQKLVRITLDIMGRIAVLCWLAKRYKENPSVITQALQLKKLEVHPLNPNFDILTPLPGVIEAERYSRSPGFTVNRSGVTEVTNWWSPYPTDYAKAIIDGDDCALVTDVYTPLFAFRDHSIKSQGKCKDVDIFYTPMAVQTLCECGGRRTLYNLGTASNLKKAVEKVQTFCTECMMMMHECTDGGAYIDGDTGGLGINKLYSFDEIALSYEEWLDRIALAIRHHAYMLPDEYRNLAARYILSCWDVDINNVSFKE